MDDIEMLINAKRLKYIMEKWNLINRWSKYSYWLTITLVFNLIVALVCSTLLREINIHPLMFMIAYIPWGLNAIALFIVWGHISKLRSGLI